MPRRTRDRTSTGSELAERTHQRPRVDDDATEAAMPTQPHPEAAEVNPQPTSHAIHANTETGVNMAAFAVTAPDENNGDERNNGSADEDEDEDEDEPDGRKYGKTRAGERVVTECSYISNMSWS